MAYRDEKKRKMAERLGISLTVLEQYVQLKQVELDEDAAPSRRSVVEVGPAPREDRPAGL